MWIFHGEAGPPDWEKNKHRRKGTWVDAECRWCGARKVRQLKDLRGTKGCPCKTLELLRERNRRRYKYERALKESANERRRLSTSGVPAEGRAVAR